MLTRKPASGKPPARDRAGLWLSIIGRLLSVVASSLVGLVAGLAIGAYRAMQELAAMPPPSVKPTLGMESAGIVPFIIWGVNLAVGAVGGAIIGLIVGASGPSYGPTAAAIRLVERESLCHDISVSRRMLGHEWHFLSGNPCREFEIDKSGLACENLGCQP